MHYHNVFLVNCKTKRDALELAKDFLVPYDENMEVRKYKVHCTDREIQRMAEHYGIDANNLPALAGKMKDWDFKEGDIDDDGLFGWSRYNPKGEWDWYQFGGRWMWSELEDKYVNQISKPSLSGNGRSYRGLRDSPKEGLIIEFPDGTTKHVDTGISMDFALKTWVNDHPEHSEVKDATDPKFYEIIDNQLLYRDKAIKWDKEQLAKYMTDEEDKGNMAEYYGDKLKNKGVRWTVDSYFWNITDDTLTFCPIDIDKDPEEWFLVNLDLHM